MHLMPNGVNCHAESQLTYIEFPFESDNLIGVHQTKAVKVLIDAYNLNRSVVLNIN